MFEVGPHHQLNYRKEIAAPLFEHIHSGDSCAVVGSASMGKTRLLDFITRGDVRQQYLGEGTGTTLLLRVDCNRVAQLNEWGLLELMLTSIVEGCDQHPQSYNFRTTFNELREPVILKENALLARRQLELAVRILINNLDLRLSFLLDEFDELYRSLPPTALANLRALRDAHKYRLSYVLFLRNIPEFLRSPAEVEGFYELFSRYTLGLTPYSAEDTAVVINQLEERHHHALPENLRQRLVSITGGHPGLVVASYDLFALHPEWAMDDPGTIQLARQPAIREECRKIWESLPPDEQHGLKAVSARNEGDESIRGRLELKGLARRSGNGFRLFSPLMDIYLQELQI